MFKSIVLALSFCILIPIKSAFSFGHDGHEIVAEIASVFMTPETKEKFKKLFDKDSIVTVSNVADKIKFFRPNTSSWHFIQIPLDDIHIDKTRSYWNEGNNIYQKMEDCISVIKTGNPVPHIKTKRDAVMFLTHFIGDMHQPLHCCNNEDKGGNDFVVKFLSSNAKNNLHRVWDSQLIQFSTKKDDLTNKQYADFLVSHMSQKEKDKYSAGNVKDWVLESHAISRGIYVQNGVKLKNGDRLTEEYVSRSTVVINEQLLKAGVRLAKILNEELK